MFLCIFPFRDIQAAARPQQTLDVHHALQMTCGSAALQGGDSILSTGGRSHLQQQQHEGLSNRVQSQVTTPSTFSSMSMKDQHIISEGVKLMLSLRPPHQVLRTLEEADVEP